MLAIGHRGAAGHVAENTVGSVRHAIASGADGVEFDVRRLHGRLLCLHDDTLDRTTNGSGPLAAQDLVALRRLRAANGEPVPFIEEMLAAAASLALVNVEIKDADIADSVVAAVDAFLAGPHARPGRIVLSSFDQTTTRALATSRYALGVLVEDRVDAGLELAQALDAFSLHLPLEHTSAAAVDAAHAAGLEVYVYTVNERPDIAFCAACGVDGVFSDYPERVLDYNRLLGEREHKP
ncbi:MAG: glycerophosphodiester phosphodiesterase [Gammaproteobacteria bacterium]